MSGFCCFFQAVVKFVLFFFNLIILLIGIAILTIGVILQIELQQDFGDLPLDISDVPTVVIIIGCVVICITFCGCCGPIMEIRWQLVLYAVFMIIFAVLKIIFVALLLGNMKNIKQSLSEWVTECFQDNIFDENFFAIEALLQCCGTTGPDSYEGKLPMLPPTCCPVSGNYSLNYDDPNNYEECAKEDAFKIGCATALPEYFTHLGHITSNIVIVIIFVELVAMTLALYMVHVINQKKYHAKGIV